MVYFLKLLLCIFILSNSTQGALIEISQLKMWPEKKVPYLINENSPKKEIIIEAIAYVNKFSILRWVPRKNEKDYVVFEFNEDGYCTSPVGKVGGEQKIKLVPYCGLSEIIHEMFHSMGFQHEQNRFDRSLYISIFDDHIPMDLKYAFYMPTSAGQFGPYDFNSIMHYHGRSPKGDTWMLKATGDKIVVEPLPSEQDFAALRFIYELPTFVSKLISATKKNPSFLASYFNTLSSDEIYFSVSTKFSQMGGMTLFEYLLKNDKKLHLAVFAEEMWKNNWAISPGRIISGFVFGQRTDIEISKEVKRIVRELLKPNPNALTEVDVQNIPLGRVISRALEN